jgi:hypothetical protein
MQPIQSYQELTNVQLRRELIDVSRILAYEHRELGTLSSDQHIEYLKAYSVSQGNSVSGREREAQFQTKELTHEIINSKAKINSLTIQRDLITFLLAHQEPTQLTEYPPARIDAEGLSA